MVDADLFHVGVPSLFPPSSKPHHALARHLVCNIGYRPSPRLSSEVLFFPSLTQSLRVYLHPWGHLSDCWSPLLTHLPHLVSLYDADLEVIEGKLMRKHLTLMILVFHCVFPLSAIVARLIQRCTLLKNV